MQRILARPHCAERLTAEDLRALPSAPSQMVQIGDAVPGDVARVGSKLERVQEGEGVVGMTITGERGIEEHVATDENLHEDRY